MKKYAAFVLGFIFVLALAGCSENPEHIPAISSFETESVEWMNEKMVGCSREDIQSKWGEPDAMLSGLWGETWCLDDSGNAITVYYDEDGLVERVTYDKIDNP